MTNITLINKLVKNSFGRGFFGNHDPILDPLGRDQIKGKNLRFISRRLWYPIPFLLELYEMVGEFTSQDGSSLRVCEYFMPNAKEYSKLFYGEFQKQVTIDSVACEQNHKKAGWKGFFRDIKNIPKNYDPVD